MAGGSLWGSRCIAQGQPPGDGVRRRARVLARLPLMEHRAELSQWQALHCLSVPHGGRTLPALPLTLLSLSCPSCIPHMQ